MAGMTNTISKRISGNLGRSPARLASRTALPAAGNARAHGDVVSVDIGDSVAILTLDRSFFRCLQVYAYRIRGSRYA